MYIYSVYLSHIKHIWLKYLQKSGLYKQSVDMRQGSNYVALSAYEVPVVIVVTDTETQTENRWHIQTIRPHTHTYTLLSLLYSIVTVYSNTGTVSSSFYQQAVRLHVHIGDNL